MTSSSPLTTLSISPTLLFQYPKTAPHSPHPTNFLPKLPPPLQPTHTNLIILRHQRRIPKPPRVTPSSSLPSPGEEERELRESVVEILVENGVSESESNRIVSNAIKYVEMLRESVRELDELGLWDSWLNERGKKMRVGIEGEITVLSFKDKVKYIANEKGDGGKIVYLESLGLGLSNSLRIARVLGSESLPNVINRVNNLKDTFYPESDDKGLAGKLGRRMMFYLSISVDEDVQQTLSFFEKIEARRGGLDMLGCAEASFRHLIESFPRLLLLSTEANVKPMVKFLESIGIQRQRVGTTLLLYPPLLFLHVKNDIRASLQLFQKAGVLDKDLGRILVKYPWVLSESINENYDEIFDFLDYEKVPKHYIHEAIKDWPILMGCSVENLKPMLKVLSDLNVRTSKLGKALATSPQLLLQKPKEFHKVVSYLQDLGFDRENIGKILIRCPEICAANVEKTLQKKVEFLTSLGISKQQIPRVLKKYPEIFVMDVDGTVKPRLRYLMKHGLSERDITSMVARFSPLVGYSVEQVLKPKLEFLLNTMGRPVKEVVGYPRYFSYSLEKKIKPRFFMLRSRNISCTLEHMLAKNDDEFTTQYLGIDVAPVSGR